MILVVDNYDSFTFNLVQYLRELGGEVEAVRNDALDVAGIVAREPIALVLSPGPRSPAEAGVSVEAVRALSGRVPILGVCLGHQAIAVAFGGQVVRAAQPVHGKAAALEHEGRGLFEGVRPGAAVGRYHSLVVSEEGWPKELRVTARAEGTGEVMALEHREHPTYGVQFHPESILTPDGRRILQNFLREKIGDGHLF